MSRNSSTMIIGAVAGLAVIIGSLIWLNKNAADNRSGVEQPEAVASSFARSAPEKDTVGEQWNWQNIQTSQEKKAQNAKNGTEPQDETTFPYTAEVIYEALRKIRLDAAGNVLIDHTALWSLDDAVTLDISPENIKLLQELIQLGLPGIAGEQTADLVGRYYEFLGAKKEFEELQQDSTDIEGHRTQLQELQTLRELYLGAETSHKLFAKSDSDSAFMIEAMSLHGRTELSQEQKKEAMRAINEKYMNQSMSALNLQDKYEAYLLRKREILADNSDDENKHKAMIDAMQTIFSERELGEIGHLPLTDL